MPTHAMSQSNPVNLASGDKVTPLLYFNAQGKIDVFYFDDTADMRRALDLDEDQHIPLDTLAKANLLNIIAIKWGLTPGDSQKSDSVILHLVKLLISENILNPEDVVSEIIEAWNTIARRTNPKISSKYSSVLLPIESYDIVLKEYIASFIQTMKSADNSEQQTSLFVEIGELVYSTLNGRSFTVSPDVKKEHIIELARKVIELSPDSRHFIRSILDNVALRDEQWFIDLKGLAIPITNAIQELDDEGVEPVFKAKRISAIQTALHSFLEADRYKNPTLGLDEKLNEDLLEITEALTNPLESIYWKDTIPSVNHFRYVVLHHIREEARETVVAIKEGTKGVQQYSISTYGCLSVDEQTESLAALMTTPQSFNLKSINSLLSRLHHTPHANQELVNKLTTRKEQMFLEELEPPVDEREWYFEPSEFLKFSALENLSVLQGFKYAQSAPSSSSSASSSSSSPSSSSSQKRRRPQRTMGVRVANSEKKEEDRKKAYVPSFDGHRKKAKTTHPENNRSEQSKKGLFSFLRW